MKESAVEKKRNRHRSAASDGVRVNAAGYLERGWVIANHKLVSFHAAFISSVLSLPAAELTARAAEGQNIKYTVLSFMFSPLHMELWISLIILYLSWHIAIAIHEMGHFLTAAKLTALNKDSQEKAEAALASGGKFGYYAQMLLLIPWGKFYGVKKDERQLRARCAVQPGRGRLGADLEPVAGDRSACRSPRSSLQSWDCWPSRTG